VTAKVSGCLGAEVLPDRSTARKVKVLVAAPRAPYVWTTFPGGQIAESAVDVDLVLDRRLRVVVVGRLVPSSALDLASSSGDHPARPQLRCVIG
jgi:hypothetical protein